MTCTFINVDLLPLLMTVILKDYFEAISAVLTLNLAHLSVITIRPCR